MLKKISVDQLTLGMHLKEFCGSWLDHPFWRTRFTLVNPQDLDAIRASSIREVWIDCSKGLDVSDDVAVAEAIESEQALDAALDVDFEEERDVVPVGFDSEIQRAARICQLAKTAVTSMFQEARLGNAVNTTSAQKLVEEISDSVSRNPGALISLARLKTADDYTYMHSVAVCALMVALSKQLGLGEEETRQAGIAGLLHDLGKAAMPLEVLNKPGRLTEEEFAIIRRHPAAGHAMLQGSGASAVAFDVVLHHHEKVDGSGYPKGLAGDEISLFAKMGAVCDVYDAITSNRPYKAGWDPSESLKKMAEWAGHFDPQVFQAFVKSLGIYPTGSLVRLASGRIAIVIDQSNASLLKPKVKVFYSTLGHARIKPEILDLSRPHVKEKIIAREDPARWQFHDLNELWTGLKGV